MATAAARIARGLHAAGVSVQVLTLCDHVPAGLLERDASAGYVVHRLGRLRDPVDALQLAEDTIERLCRAHGATLIHGFYVLHAGYLAVAAAKLLGLRSVVSVRGNDVDRMIFSPPAFGMIEWALRHADAVGCVSTDLVARVSALTGRDDIRYTPNAVDASRFAPRPADSALRRELFPDAPQEALRWPLLGCVGELRFKKGLHIALDAFRRLSEQRPAQLLLVGGARKPERQLLRNFLEAHPSLRPHVRLVEAIVDPEEMVRHYSLLDVLLCPSLWEGMPNAVLEAMACGCCVVASDAGGLKDLIRHGETGALMVRDELSHLAELLAELLDAGPGARAEMGARARHFVTREHSPEIEAERTVDLYRAALGPRVPSARSPS
ncbi:MAG TPA: glycosyltransferase [Armatimonadota bacterium]|nr:glycosyltransferase [Armatimonadota bacterium]